MSDQAEPLPTGDVLESRQFIPIEERFHPSRRINKPRVPSFDAIDMRKSWREHRSNPVAGRTNNKLQEFFTDVGINYLDEWRSAIDKARQEGKEELWVLELGSGAGVVGFEIAAAGQNEKLPENEIAEEIIHYAQERGVRLNYVGITEVPADSDSAVPEQWEEKSVIQAENSPSVSAINIAYTLDYSQEPYRSLSELIKDFGNIQPDIILANFFFQYLTPEAKRGVMADIAELASDHAVMLSFPWEPMAISYKELDNANAEIIAKLKGVRQIQEIFGTEEGKVRDFQIVGRAKPILGFRLGEKKLSASDEPH